MESRLHTSESLVDVAVLSVRVYWSDDVLADTCSKSFMFPATAHLPC